MSTKTKTPRADAAPRSTTLRHVLGALSLVAALGSPVHASPPGVDAALASPQVRAAVEWILATQDNDGAPFFVVDKRNARVFVYEADGRLRGDAPVLLGLARGDDTVPGIGDKPLAQIRPHERTTPAGRFVAERGVNTHGDDIVWVDYDAAVSLHRMRSVNAGERRLERMMSPTPADNRISYGCINVPPKFYDEVVDPTWNAGRGVIVYVLPEVKPLQSLFRPRASMAMLPATETDGAQVRRVSAGR